MNGTTALSPADAVRVSELARHVADAARLSDEINLRLYRQSEAVRGAVHDVRSSLSTAAGDVASLRDL